MAKKLFSQKKKDKKEPISLFDKNAFMTDKPLWSFRLLDDTNPKWNMPDDHRLFSELKSFEGMTWQEIVSSSGGKKKGHGSNSHFIPVADITKEAQKRLVELNLDSEDTLLSLRVGNRPRIWGFLRSRVFEIIWYDKNHEISLSK